MRTLPRGLIAISVVVVGSVWALFLAVKSCRDEGAPTSPYDATSYQSTLRDEQPTGRQEAPSSSTEVNRAFLQPQPEFQNRPEGVSPDERMRDLLAEMRIQGIKVPKEVVFPDQKAWEELRITWEALSSDLSKAWTERQQTGKSVAKRRLESGQYVQFLAKDYPEPETDRATGHRKPEYRPWLLSNTPDEWILSSHSWDKTLDAAVVKVVRIPVGDCPELDARTRHHHDMTLVRTRAIEDFLQTFNQRRTR